MSLVLVVGAGLLVLLGAAFWQVKRHKHSDRGLLAAFVLFLSIVVGVSVIGVSAVYLFVLAVSLTGHRLYAYLGLGPLIVGLAWQFATKRIQRSSGKTEQAVS